MAIPKKSLRRVSAFLLLCCCCAASYLYLKHRNKFADTDASSPVAAVALKDSVVTTSLYSGLLDMENMNDERISTEKFFSGKQSCKFSAKAEYGIPFSKKFQEIPDFQNITSVDVTIQVFAEKKIKDAVIVLTIDSPQTRNAMWEGQPVQISSENAWNAVTATYKLKPELLKPENTITVYIWNKSKEEFYADDIALSFKGTMHVITNTQQASNTNFFYDFETNDGLSNTENVKVTTAHSGTKACDLSGGEEYSPSVIRKISEITSDSLKKISMSIWVYPLNDNPNVVFTASVVNAKGESKFWDGEGSESEHFKKNQWSKINASFKLPAEKFSPDDKIIVNLWNKGRDKVIADDIEIVYGDPSPRKGIPNNIDVKSIYEKQYVSLKNTPPFKKLFFEKQEADLSALSSYTTNDEFLSGNFDKSSVTDELICIKAGKAMMYSFPPDKKSLKTVWEQHGLTDGPWQCDTKKFAGDFNADGNPDVLSVDIRTGDWQLLDFAGGSWKAILKSAAPLPKKWLRENNVSISGLFTANHSDALILFGKSKDEMLFLNVKNSRFEEGTAETGKNDPAVTRDHDVIFTGNFDDDADKELLQLNTAWRFELKLIDVAKNDLTVAYAVDFKGYTKDYNPKYYEASKLITGNFTDPKMTEVLVFSCNCADASYDGINCKSIENLPYLPSSVNIYRPGKTHE